MADHREPPEPEWKQMGFDSAADYLGYIDFCDWQADPDSDPDEYVDLPGYGWVPMSQVRVDDAPDVAPAPRPRKGSKRAPLPPASAAEPGAQLLTLAEASERIRTPSETIRYWVWQGRLKAFRPGRSVLVLAADLDALVAGGETVAKRAAAAKRGRK